LEGKAVIKTTFLKACSYLLTLISLVGSYYLGFALIWVSLPFVILGGMGILLSGEGYIDMNGFKVKTLIGTFYIEWDEIEYIETGSGNMIIGSQEKRIAFPSFEYWNGKEKEKAVEIFCEVIEKKNIEIKETRRAILPIYKGTRERA
jgi:hypothetical protein